MKEIRFLIFIFFFANSVSAQITLGFQGGEPGDTWTFTSTGADATATTQATLNPNIVTGTRSLVAGGNTSGGSCIDGGSGNGPDTERKFTFSPLDISTSSNQTRTLTFSYGNRFPVCVGTGWDQDEDLIFTAYHDGVAQTPQTVAVGNNNAVFNIKTHSYSWTVPTCVNSFYFELKITTNRRDELLFIDDVKLTTPSLNTPPNPTSPISASPTVCTGSTTTVSVNNNPNTTYTWGGLPAGATLTAPNSTTTSNTIGINWGTTPPGTYTITLTPNTTVCGISTPGTTQTVDITVVSVAPLTTTGTSTICTGQSVQISASGATSYNWDNGLGSGSTFTVSPATTTTYNVTGTVGNCTATGSVTVTVIPVPAVSATANPTSVCAGSSTTLTASGATTYTWSPATGLSSTSGASVTATPASSISYTVTGSNGTCSASAAVTIAVTPLPSITVTANPPNICAGASTTLTATGATTYSWSPATGLSATTGNSVTASPSTTTTYTVTGTTGNCTATQTVTVTVSATIAINVTAAPNTICAGGSSVLTASGATNCTWSPATGLSSTTGNSVTASPSATTAYTVTGTVGTCSGTGTVTLTVSPLPAIGITAAPNTICPGNSTTLTASGATTYVWSPATGLSSTTGTTVTATPSATTTYTATGTTSGCTSSQTITVTVSTNPTISVTSSTNTICQGGSASLTSSGANTYTWSPASSLSAATGTSVTASPSSTTTYTVTGTSGNCTGTGSITITVTPTPVLTVTATPPSVCPGGTSTLNVSGATNYVWHPNPGLSGTTGPSVTATPASTTTYTVEGMGNSCPGTATITVTVSPVPNVNAGNDQTVCSGIPVILQGSGAATYTWDNGVIDGVPFTPNTTRIYTVTGITAAGCTGTDQVVVTLEATPTVLFAADTTSGCLPLDVQFTSTTSGANNYHWDFGDGIISTDAHPAHTFLSSGCKDVTLEVTSPNGCLNRLTLSSYICVAPDPVAAFQINPAELNEDNPVANMINLSENAVTYLWDFGDQSASTETSPKHTFAPSLDGNYVVTLYAYSISGCVDSVQVILPFAEDPIYYVPNVFTPDGNEVNQTFNPVFTAGYDPYSYHLEIYNRWGERLFESNNPKIGWDGVSVAGTIVPDGIYIWKISFKLKNNDDIRKIHGSVTLVR